MEIKMSKQVLSQGYTHTVVVTLHPSPKPPPLKIPTLCIAGDRAMHRRMAAEEAIYAHRYQHPS
jgi:hypothetical protein